MTHDPLCPIQTMCKCKVQECWECREVVLCQCDLIREVRDSERFSTVEGAVVIASQSGASPELVQLLSSMYERREAPWTDEARREAAAELTRLGQEMGMIP